MNQTTRRNFRPPQISRRAMMTSGAASLAWLLSRRPPGLLAQESAEKLGSDRVTEIEVHEITIPYEDWIADEVRPDKRRLITLNYAAPLSTEYWDPDGSAEFGDMLQRLEKEGMVLE